MSRLRAERERLGLTQGEMESLLWNMPHRTYQDIESEVRVPPPWVMAAIFERLTKRKSAAGRAAVGCIRLLGRFRETPEAALALLALKKRSLSATVPQKAGIFVPRAGKRRRIPQKEIVK